MKTRNFVLLVVASAGMAVYGEPINLGCSARGPLAALAGSVAFREAIGAANPANFLGSVYDVNGQQLSPESSKALHCPWFIDSDAKPSASASKAILNAEANLQAEKPVQPTAARVESGAVVISSAAGVVVEIPQPEAKNSGAWDGAQAPSKPEARGTQGRQVAKAAAPLELEKRQIQPEVSKPGPEAAVQAAAAPSAVPTPVEKTSGRIDSANQPQESPALSVAQALGLIKQVEGQGGVASLEFNPVVAAVYVLALFVAVLALGLLICYPRGEVVDVDSRLNLYQEAFERFDSLENLRVGPVGVRVIRTERPVQIVPRRRPATWVSGD